MSAPLPDLTHPLHREHEHGDDHDPGGEGGEGDGPVVLVVVCWDRDGPVVPEVACLGVHLHTRDVGWDGMGWDTKKHQKHALSTAE